jgi:hypothetical protein
VGLPKTKQCVGEKIYIKNQKSFPIT